MMGHSTVQATERYAHLRPELFGAADRAALKVRLAPNRGPVGHNLGTANDDDAVSTPPVTRRVARGCRGNYER
jgi:hypothetical protein